MICILLGMTTEVQDAERDVAESKQGLQQSLRVARETTRSLSLTLRKKMLPTLVVAGLVGAAALGIAVVVARGMARPRWRAPRQTSLTGEVARAAGMWLLRAVAVRVAAELVAEVRAVGSPELAESSPVV